MGDMLAMRSFMPVNPSPAHSSSSEAGPEVLRIIRTLQDLFSKHSVTLKQAFTSFERTNDVDLKGGLSVLEFKHGFHQLNVTVSENEIIELMRHMGKGSDGRVDYEAFADTFQSTQARAQADLAER